MQGYDLIKRVQKERTKNPNNIFIKWWRREEDWIDFDLVSRFLERYDYGTDIGGFSLIDQDEMWRTLESRCKGRVSKVERDGTCLLRYTPPKGAEIEESAPEYPYTPEMMLKILDLETNNNYVD